MIPRSIPVLLVASWFGLGPVTAVPASAQAQNGNHANGLNYQPRPGVVRDKEEAAGIAPPAERERAMNNDLERLNQQLQNAENNDPLVHPGGRQTAPRR